MIDESVKVSVIMPAYNAGKFISQSICSVLNQTYKNIEFVIVNDGATDNTADIIMEYESKYPDTILFVNKEINEGTAKTLNVAMEYASGDYMCWLSADDLYADTMVESQLSYLLEHPELDACFSLSTVIDENSKIIDIERKDEAYLSALSAGDSTLFYRWLILLGNAFHGCSFMGKREKWLEVGGFDSKYRYAHDYDFWLRFAAIANIGFVREYNVMGRTYPTQISKQGHNDKDAIMVFSEFAQNRPLFDKLMQRAGFDDYCQTMHKAFQNRIGEYQFFKIELLTVIEEYRKFIESNMN